MTKEEVKRRIFDYFKTNGIAYRFLNEEKKPIMLETSDTVYLCVNIPEVIGGHIETCIRFREEYLYAQSYYCQPVTHNEEENIRAARIINYLNMNLNYDCNSLYDHIFILDEAEGDIFNGLLIRYELINECFYESMDHILNFSVQQLVDVCVPVIRYIAGETSYFQATKVGIDYNLMGKEIPFIED